MIDRERYIYHGAIAVLLMLVTAVWTLDFGMRHVRDLQLLKDVTERFIRERNPGAIGVFNSFGYEIPLPKPPPRIVEAEVVLDSTAVQPDTTGD